MDVHPRLCIFRETVRLVSITILNEKWIQYSSLWDMLNERIISNYYDDNDNGDDDGGGCGGGGAV